MATDPDHADRERPLWDRLERELARSRALAATTAWVEEETARTHDRLAETHDLLASQHDAPEYRAVAARARAIAATARAAAAWLREIAYGAPGRHPARPAVGTAPAGGTGERGRSAATRPPPGDGAESG